MPEVVSVQESKPLSQVERVVDTFVAPSKTFTDVLRSQSWWLPYLLLVLSSLFMAAAIQQKVGWPVLADNEIRSNPKSQARIADMSPDQVAAQRRITAGMMQGTLFGAPVSTLFFILIFAVVLWPTINFGFGGAATFGQAF